MIIRDLMEHGKSRTDIADLVGISWQAVRDYLLGAEPRESNGRSILALHYRTCGKELTLQRIREAGGFEQARYLIDLLCIIDDGKLR